MVEWESVIFMHKKQVVDSAGFSQKLWLVAGVSLSAGVLLLASCDAPSDENSASKATANTTATANNLTVTPSPTAQAKPHRGMSYTLFVPNDDAMLSRQIVRDTSTLVPITYDQKAKRALELLWKKMEFLPSGTQLLEAPRKEKNGVVRLNFNKAFLHLDTSPDNVVILILDSISQTLGALEYNTSKINKPAKIQIVVEGKRITEFNQFTLAEPWQAEAVEEIVPEKTVADENNSDSKTDNNATDSKTDNAVGGSY